MHPQIERFKYSEIESIQLSLDCKKAPGFDLTTGKIIKELPETCIRLITIVKNAILRLSYFSDQWKVVQVIVIAKSRKPHEEVQSYRPIILRSVLSKCWTN